MQLLYHEPHALILGSRQELDLQPVCVALDAPPKKNYQLIYHPSGIYLVQDYKGTGQLPVK